MLVDTPGLSVMPEDFSKSDLQQYITNSLTGWCRWDFSQAAQQVPEAAVQAVVNSGRATDAEAARRQEAAARSVLGTYVPLTALSQEVKHGTIGRHTRTPVMHAG